MRRSYSVFAAWVILASAAFTLTSLAYGQQRSPAVLAPAVAWTKTFGGKGSDSASSVQQTSDGGYIIAGETTSFGSGDNNYDAYLIKTDKTGRKVWERTFGGLDFDEACAVRQTRDGGYIFAGLTDSFGAGKGDVYLVKTDGKGRKLWQRTFGGSDFDFANDIQETRDGGFILVGLTWSSGPGSDDNLYLIKADKNGNEVWEKTYGARGMASYGFSVQQTSDGGYIALGATLPIGSAEGTYEKAYLLKTNASGKMTWSKTFGGSAYDSAGAVRQTSDGGYIVAGTFSSGIAGQGYDIYLRKMDKSGKLLWEKHFGGKGNEWVNSVQQTRDGGYIIASDTDSIGHGEDDAYLIKTDKSGKKMWELTLGGTASDSAEAVQQTSDGGYIVAGDTESSGAGNRDIYLVKIKP